ncbi:MAG TPA: hypothetical protein VHZ07_21065 [Bryobacteraceae bacterium]|jgi:hypothetical protein|nr:hypothetical protein [Bryobacteraceae bacterium]
MAEQLFKLSPDRDLQCYFLTPSAIAAMSQASPTGFTVSGKWRQQFDWAVIEWNRDNVFEHPALRYLPDGNLSGLTLSYTEQRTNCIPIESNLFPVVSWDQLRIWAVNADGTETVYYVPIAAHAKPVGAGYVSAAGTMTLVASPGTGNHVGLAFLEEHYYYTVGAGDSLSTIAAGIAANINNINQGSVTFTAASDGPSVTVTYAPQAGKALYTDLQGANGNRIGMYGFAGGGTTAWKVPSVTFSGGQFPQSYNVSFNFASLLGTTDADDTPQSVPTTSVRKLRWTWSADLQPGIFAPQEFSVAISNWAVTGTNRQYFVAGPGSRRIEDTDPSVTYSGSWTTDIGNYSGSRIHSTTITSASVSITYQEPLQHSLYVASQYLSPGSSISVSVDGGAPQSFLLDLPGEDVLCRLPLGTYGAGQHTVVATNLGTSNPNYTTSSFYFDFLEIAYPSANLPTFTPQPQLSLATDWDTYHSQSLPAERTAWLINTLGFTGRVNHYTGALWFYEIVRGGTQYATASVTIPEETVSQSGTMILDIGTEGSTPTPISHLILPDDTADTVAQAMACLINLGSNLLWAGATKNVLTLTARAMGTQGNTAAIWLYAGSEGFTITPSNAVLSGGVDGTPYDLDSTDPLQQTLMTTADFWQTDLTAQPRINRAARDWHQAYFTALKGYGIDAVASFSTELLNADSSVTAGIAQRYPDGTPVVLNTPSIQTNFSPNSLAYWTQVYLDMAQLQSNAGLVPYLQSGEVQWWYDPKPNVGLPFYDAYTTQQFQLQYGTAMKVILENTADPSQYPNETAFLPTLIGAYTAAIRGALQANYPGCRFEVLYPTDTNDTPLNQVINYPNGDWTPANLTRLKTESFTFTLNRNLDQCVYSMGVSAAKGFFNQQRSHLVGISDSWTPWMKEVSYALAQGMDSVVLFALDQYCLIGYPVPPFLKMRSSRRLA